MDAKRKDEEKQLSIKKEASPMSKHSSSPSRKFPSPVKYSPLEKNQEQESSFFLVSMVKAIWNFKAGLYMMATGIAW